MEMDWLSVKRLLSVVLAGAVVFLFVPGTKPAHAKSDHSHSLVAKTPNAAINTYNSVDAPDAVVAIATLAPLAPSVSARLIRPAPCSYPTRLEDTFHPGRAPPSEPTIRIHMRV
jgi:hypothetical protein